MACGVYNFVAHQLKPKVSASVPAVDGYEVTNLISGDNRLLSQGFMACNLSRPPVDVNIELICPINLHCIMILSTVGSQKTSAIEIFALKANCDVSISKVYFEESGIAVYNRKYFPNRERLYVPEGYKVDFFSKLYVVPVVEKLRIRILRTNRSIPCIGKIEIWGTISNLCDDITKQTITCLANRKPKQDSNVKVNKPSTSDANSHQDQLEIPDDFIDPITCEIMALPMTLPCGKTVDQSTLEKHQESEAKWGRNASDPFTGKYFTTDHRPVLNAALKNRIDEFLFQNAHRKETQNVARTVGRASELKRSYTNKVSSDLQNKRAKPHTVSADSGSTSITGSSLDELIENAFKNYNLIRFSTETATELKNCCAFCNNSNDLYVLLCEHFICRQCLTKQIEYKCKVCNQKFNKNDARRFHKV